MRRRSKLVQDTAGFYVVFEIRIGRVDRARNNAVPLALVAFAQIDKDDAGLTGEVLRL